MVEPGEVLDREGSDGVHSVLLGCNEIAPLERIHELIPRDLFIEHKKREKKRKKRDGRGRWRGKGDLGAASEGFELEEGALGVDPLNARIRLYYK